MNIWREFSSRSSLIGLTFASAIISAPAIGQVVADSFQNPLDTMPAPAQNVGEYYNAPFYGYHLGVDLPATPGTAVHAIASGVVKYWNWVPCLGNAVNIEHTLPDSSKRVSVYYHIEKKDIVLGPTVTRGQVIGYVRKLPAVCGTGNHLHFGIRLGEYNTGNDCRTNVWFYPGYTSLHVKSCQNPPLPYLKDPIQDQSDPRHGAILAEWEQYPLAFIDAHSSPPPPPPPPPVNGPSLQVTPSNTANIFSNPPGINCGANCSARFPLGSEVGVTISPSAGWFVMGITTNATLTQGLTLCYQALEMKNLRRWLSDVTSHDVVDQGFGCNLLMDKDVTLSASFLPRLYVAKTGSGFVTGPGILCSLDCNQIYDTNSIVTLTAAPNPGEEFIGWGGDCSGVNTCTVDMTVPRTVTASFTERLPLDLSVSKTGLGTITTSPYGISCGVDCLASYPNGTEVTVTVSPDAGWYITGITTNATFTQSGTICRQAFEMDIIRNGGFTGTFSCPILMEKYTTFSVNMIQR